MLITIFLNTKLMVFWATKHPEPKRQIHLQHIATFRYTNTCLIDVTVSADTLLTLNNY